MADLKNQSLSLWKAWNRLMWSIEHLTVLISKKPIKTSGTKTKNDYKLLKIYRTTSLHNVLVAGIHDVGRLFVSWQGLANKSSWDPRCSIGRRDAHQTWGCRTNQQKKPLIIRLKRLARGQHMPYTSSCAIAKLFGGWVMVVLPVCSRWSGDKHQT